MLYKNVSFVQKAQIHTAKDFLLNHVLKEIPFKINQIQVDSGIKFLGNFE